MSDKIDKPYAVPHGPECPRCHQQIVEAQDVTPDASNVFKKGKLIVCGACALICRVGDSKLIPVSTKEVLSYPPRIQLMLLATCKRVAAHIDRIQNN
jgi:ferredoxin